jgi:beta-fructofuranosidase
MTTRLLLAVPLVAACLSATSQSARDRVLQSAVAQWRLGSPQWKPTGRIESDARVARLTDAYLDAGTGVGVSGSAVTVYLRARDPRGQWTYGLFNKRGSHEVVTFNLFSVDLGGTPGPDIGFEVHTDAGFVAVSFPVSRIDATAWHDFAGRYDGRAIELLCDGQVMAKKRWKGGRLTQNGEPVLLGAETDHGRVIRPFTGEIEEAALWPRALSDAEMAALMRRSRIVPDPTFTYREPYASPVQFRPEFGRLADTIPFYWKGEYHVFYLRAIDKVPWEHIVSRDLVHWKELPTALVSDGKPDSPDGLHMFTGSVAEKDGVFHIFYTGWNPANPAGREFIMHATSPDLIHWTKRPEDILGPDGRLYSNAHDRDFRDPYVFWNAPENQWWMIFCSGAHTGLATSPDLKSWTFQPPLQSDYAGIGTPECPDHFQIGATHYLICSPTGTSSTIQRASSDIHGPYRDPVSRVLDTPILYAAKRMFDGKRHVLTGWLRDLDPERDDGAFQWGGTQCVPRELTAGPSGQLFSRPVREAIAVFRKTALDIRKKPPARVRENRWTFTEKGLRGTAGGGSQCSFDAPANYLLWLKATLDPAAELTVVLREQENGAGYRMTIRPAPSEAEIAGPGFAYRRKIVLDPSKPVTLRAFVQGTTIECFVNDAFAFSCRAYNHASGRLGLNVSHGSVDVQELTLKTP